MSKLVVLVVAAVFVTAGCGGDGNAEPANGETSASGQVPFDHHG